MPWTRAWRLTPRRVSAPAQVAVTALRGWLQCPFRFYLRQVLGLAAIDPAKSELDARDFGALCHAALEAMGREAMLRDCTDAAVLRQFLLAELERHARACYGEALSLPLIIQLESARQRLARAAEVQARERAAGWVIEQVEKKIAVETGGLLVKGKIDRIDRHEQTGAVRVLDYKTSDSPAAPGDTHVRAPRKDETPPAWAVLDPGGNRRPPGIDRGEWRAVLRERRMSWRTPGIDTLERPSLGTARWIGLLTLRAYIAFAIVIVVIKLVQTIS